MKRYRYEIILFISTLLYGSAYGFMPLMAELLQPFSANTLKAFFAILVLVPFVLKEKIKFTKNLMKGGLILSFTLFSANYLLQLVSDHMSAGKSGFISSLYVVLVPIISFIFLKQKQSLKVWFSVLLTTFGLYLLFGFDAGNGFTIYDVAILFVPVIFAVEIFAISKYTKLVPPVQMSFVALLFVFLFNLTGALLTETEPLNDFVASIPLGILLGSGCLGLAIYLQTASQKYLDDILSGVIMSLESVVSAVMGFLVLNQVLSTKELIGCAIMLLGTMLCELFTNEKV